MAPGRMCMLAHSCPLTRATVTGRGDRPDRSKDEHTTVCISMQPGKLFNGRPTFSPAGVICTSDHAFRGEDFHAIWEYSEGCGKGRPSMIFHQLVVNLPITGYTGGSRSGWYDDKLYERNWTLGVLTAAVLPRLSSPKSPRSTFSTTCRRKHCVIECTSRASQ